MKNAHSGARAGFSTLEALITVVLTAAVLALALCAGTEARDLAFRAANRATSAQDLALAADAFRLSVSALDWTGRSAAPTGRATRLSGPVILVRGVAGMPAGPGRLDLELQRNDAGLLLISRQASQAPQVIADLGPRGASFSYSVGGQDWSSTWDSHATPGQSVLVRLASSDGAIDWIARAHGPEGTRRERR